MSNLRPPPHCFANEVFFTPQALQRPFIINLPFFFVTSVRSFVEVFVLHLIHSIIFWVCVIRDISWRDGKNLRGNNPLLPRSIRSVIVGKSGCGKTTLETNNKEKNLLK